MMPSWKHINPVNYHTDLVLVCENSSSESLCTQDYRTAYDKLYYLQMH